MNPTHNYKLSKPTMVYILNLFLREDDQKQIMSPIPEKTLLAHQLEEIKKNLFKCFGDPEKIIMKYLSIDYNKCKKYKKQIYNYQGSITEISLMLPDRIAYIAFMPQTPCTIIFNYDGIELNLVDTLTASRIFNMTLYKKPAQYFITCARNLDYHIHNPYIKPTRLYRASCQYQLI